MTDAEFAGTLSLRPSSETTAAMLRFLAVVVASACDIIPEKVAIDHVPDRAGNARPGCPGRVAHGLQRLTVGIPSGDLPFSAPGLDATRARW